MAKKDKRGKHSLYPRKMLADVDSLMEKVRERIATDSYSISSDSPFEKAIVKSMSQFNLHVLEFHSDMAEILHQQDLELEYAGRRMDNMAHRMDMLEVMILQLAEAKLISFERMDKDRKEKTNGA